MQRNTECFHSKFDFDNELAYSVREVLDKYLFGVELTVNHHLEIKLLTANTAPYAGDAKRPVSLSLALDNALDICIRQLVSLNTNDNPDWKVVTAFTWSYAAEAYLHGDFCDAFYLVRVGRVLDAKFSTICRRRTSSRHVRPISPTSPAMELEQCLAPGTVADAADRGATSTTTTTTTSRLHASCLRSELFRKLRCQCKHALRRVPLARCAYCSQPDGHVITTTMSSMFSSGCLMACGGCRVVLYCSQQCQVNHWRSGHAEECQQQDSIVIATTTTTTTTTTDTSEMTTDPSLTSEMTQD